MKVVELELKGVKFIEVFYSQDSRGDFIKLYNEEFFIQNNINFSIKETYFSVSNKNVIRGMHFQTPPYDHDKLIYVQKGSVMDVVLDIRKGSPTFGKSIIIHLNEKERKAIFIPKGFAHGFKALEDETMMVYQVSSVYHAKSDKGIRWDSIGIDWQIENPIISKRDAEFACLNSFYE